MSRIPSADNARDPATVFKILVAIADGTHLLVAVIPVSRTLSLKRLCRAAGVKTVDIAPVRDAERATGYVTGGISPIGMKCPLPVHLAREALDCQRIYVSGGKRGLEIGLAPNDLIRSCDAWVGPLCHPLDHTSSQSPTRKATSTCGTPRNQRNRR